MNNKEKEGVQFQSAATVWALTKPTYNIYARERLYTNIISSEKGGEEKSRPRDSVQQQPWPRPNAPSVFDSGGNTSS